MSQTPEFRFLQAMRAELQQRAETMRDQLASGSQPDYPSVRHAVGYLRAITDMLEFAEKKNAELMRS